MSEVDLCVGITVWKRKEGREKVNEPVKGEHVWA